MLLDNLSRRVGMWPWSCVLGPGWLHFAGASLQLVHQCGHITDHHVLVVLEKLGANSSHDPALKQVSATVYLSKEMFLES